MQFSTPVRNARADVVETQIGTDPILEVRTGAPPANPAAADGGTLLASMTLPSNWLTNAANGIKGLSGTWQDLLANAAGTIGHYRIWDSTRTTCHIQGAAGGPSASPVPEMLFDDDETEVNQLVSVVTFAWTEGNA